MDAKELLSMLFAASADHGARQNRQPSNPALYLVMSDSVPYARRSSRYKPEGISTGAIVQGGLVCSTLVVAVCAGSTGPSDSAAVLLVTGTAVAVCGAARITSTSPLPLRSLAVLLPARFSRLQK